jgi:hypothetical protein
LPCPGLQVIEKQQLRRCMSCGNGPFSDGIPTRAQYTAISYCATDTAYGYLAASRFLYIGNTTELPRPATGGTVERGASSSSFNQYGREKAKTQRSWLDHCVLAALLIGNPTYAMAPRSLCIFIYNPLLPIAAQL